MLNFHIIKVDLKNGEIRYRTILFSRLADEYIVTLRDIWRGFYILFGAFLYLMHRLFVSLQFSEKKYQT